jgi:hypothetical protein
MSRPGLHKIRLHLVLPPPRDISSSLSLQRTTRRLATRSCEEKRTAAYAQRILQAAHHQKTILSIAQQHTTATPAANPRERPCGHTKLARVQGESCLVAWHKLGGVVPRVLADGVRDVLRPVLDRALAGHDGLHTGRRHQAVDSVTLVIVPARRRTTTRQSANSTTPRGAALLHERCAPARKSRTSRTSRGGRS